MSKTVNYIDAHKALCTIITKDTNLNATHKSFMEAIFIFWNRRCFVKKFIVNRDDLMQVAKIHNKKTYYKVIAELVEMEYLIYEPSKNPSLGSTFGMGKKYSCRGLSDGLSDGFSTVTFHKLLNNKLLNSIVQHIDQIEENLEKWLAGKAVEEGRKYIPLMAFEIFWSLYPKQEKQDEAWQEWQNLTDEEINDLFGKLSSHIANYVQEKANGRYRYIPQPRTFLAEKRWKIPAEAPVIPIQNGHTVSPSYHKKYGS